LNNEYHESILATLSASPFVHETILNVDDRDEVWFIRADVHFIDNSLLHFRELFVKQETPVKKHTPIITNGKMERWSFVTITRRTSHTYLLRRITNTLGKLKSLQQTLPIYNLF
jgi:hypothetical protein